MPLWILSVAPTPDKQRTDWYFDSEHEFVAARERAMAVDPYVVWRHDYLSDASEFNTWLDKERQCASDLSTGIRTPSPKGSRKNKKTT